MSGLYLPRNAQMSKPIVFWYNRTLDFIMLPPSPLAPPPSGYQRIECRHAADVDIWSRRLRRQEQRIREMTDQERYEFEEPIRTHGIQVLREQLAKATDPINREFLAASIRMIEQKRALARKEVVESYMHCEGKENVAP